MVAFDKSKEEVLEDVNSSLSGLSSIDAQKRLDKNGKNLLVGKKKKSEFSEDDVKKFNDKIQTLTDDFIKKIDTMVSEKEAEIMKI